MKNKMTHFAIHIDDIERAKNFYDGVFDWGFNSYGQGDFLQIKADKSENGELIGAVSTHTDKATFCKSKLTSLRTENLSEHCSQDNIHQFLTKLLVLNALLALKTLTKS